MVACNILPYSSFRALVLSLPPIIIIVISSHPGGVLLEVNIWLWPCALA